MCPRVILGVPGVTISELRMICLVFVIQQSKWSQNISEKIKLRLAWKKYIQQKIAAIYFSNEPLSKTGLWRGWLHLHGLTRAKAWITNWKSSCPQSDFSPRHLAKKVATFSRRPQTLILIERIRMKKVLPLLLHIRSTWSYQFKSVVFC